MQNGSYITKSEYNLRSRGSIGNNKPYNLKDNSGQTSRKRKRDDSVDLDKEILRNEEFTWNNFNRYKSPHVQVTINTDEKKNWVSATSIKNYLMKEPLIDWFDLYYLDKGFNDGNQLFLDEKETKKKEIQNEMNKLSVFFKMGNLFEVEVIKCLRQKYPNQIKKVVTKSVHENMNDITLQYMREGVPIIEQAALYNHQNKTYGIADLLIRSDWLNRLFTKEVMPENEIHIKANYLSGNYHYRVIDIKWTTMYLCANGKTLRNSQRFPAYKGQLAIYNAALGLMQGYTPNEAYVLTKSWNLNGGKDEGYNCFTQLGVVDYNGFDSRYIQETYDAINWIRNVRYNGQDWSCGNPTIPELYPNMCNRYDTPYHGVKKELADQLKELTQIWMVGVKHRKIAHDNKIFTWDDPRCDSESLGINGNKIGPVVDKIIDINRTTTSDLIRPEHIKNNTSNWQEKGPLDFYIDFEGITGCLYYQDIDLTNSRKDNQIVFMVGIGYEDEHGNWKYQCFTANQINRYEEKSIINEFRQFIENKITIYMRNHNISDRNNCQPRFFHWSHAEKTIMNMLDKRHHNEWYQWKNKITWIDMCKVFIDEPIVIKGAKKFNLKDIAKTMASHDMIKTQWQCDGPENGLDAMIEAIEYYHYFARSNKTIEETSKYNKIMDSIRDYNEVDCKVVWEAVSYLRKHHKS